MEIVVSFKDKFLNGEEFTSFWITDNETFKRYVENFKEVYADGIELYFYKGRYVHYNTPEEFLDKLKVKEISNLTAIEMKDALESDVCGEIDIPYILEYAEGESEI